MTCIEEADAGEAGVTFVEAREECLRYLRHERDAYAVAVRIMAAKISPEQARRNTNRAMNELAALRRLREQGLIYGEGQRP